MSEEITKKILKEMEQMSKGGEGSGQKGHKTPELGHRTPESDKAAMDLANQNAKYKRLFDLKTGNN